MGTDSVSLLRGLGSGVRPAGVESAQAKGAQVIETLRFEDLLNKAQAGAVSSGVPVRVAKDAGVELSKEQLLRLSVAADQAEAQGASRAAVIIDGKVLQLDVTTRTVTGSVPMSGTRVLAGVDAVIVAQPQAAGKARTIGPPSAGVFRLVNDQE